MVEGKPSRWYLVCLTVFTIIGGILRFRNLDGPSLWIDELASLNSVMMPSWEAAMGTGQSNIGIGGWFNFHIISIIGNSDFAVRSTSAVGGTLLIPIVAEYGRRSHDEKAGIIASSMIVASFFAVMYSQEFRLYMTTTPLIWFAFLLMLGKEKNHLIDVTIIVLLTFGFVSHYISGLTVILALLISFICQTITWIRDELDWSKNFIINMNNFISSGAGKKLHYGFCLITISLFMLKMMMHDSANLNHSTWIPETPKNTHLLLLYQFFGNPDWGSSMEGVPEMMWIIMLISPLVMLSHHFLFKNKKIEEEAEWVLWALSLGSLGIILLYSDLVRPLFVFRYFSYSMPAWFLIFGVTISKTIDIVTIGNTSEFSITEPLAIIIATAFMMHGIHWLVLDYEYYESDIKSDFKGMSEWLDENVDTNEIYIISQPSIYSWELYLKRMNSDVKVDAGYWGPIPQSGIDEMESENPEIIIKLTGHQLSWNDKKVEAALNDTHVLVEEIKFTKGLIQVYTHPGVEW